MFSDLIRVLSRARGMLAGALSGFLKLALRIFLFLVAAEAVLVGGLTAVASVRSKRREEPRESFPRQEPTEIRLESSDERLKIYCDYTSVYEAMFEEIERAERTIFIETFTWLEDEVGRRFVETLARKAREGVEVYASFDALANISRSAEFKRFPEEIHTQHFRPFSRPASFLNPYNCVRSHRKILTVQSVQAAHRAVRSRLPRTPRAVERIRSLPQGRIDATKILNPTFT